MSFRVMHHQGTKELLFEKIKAIANELKNDEYKDDFDEGQWEYAIDEILNGNFDTSNITPIVLSYVINNNFTPVSEDYTIQGYDNLASKTSPRLAEILDMFVNGRNFSTGDAENGDEVTCGYLTPDEVKEFLELLKEYTLEELGYEDEDNDEDFVNDLIDTFSMLVEKKSGDLFIMN